MRRANLKPENLRATTSRVAHRQIVTLAIAGLLLLVIAATRFGWHRIFTHGWWRW